MNKKELKALITLAGSIDPSLARAMMQAQNEVAKANKGMQKSTSGMMNTIKNGGISFAKSVGATLLAMTVAATVAFGAMATSGIEYASSLNEVQNVVEVTFGQNSEIIDEFSKTALESYGLIKLEAKQFTGTMGAMLKSMGLTSDETLTMSQNLAALAGDYASFYNLSNEDAFAKIRAGISGETEPLKQLGINMSVANLEAYALAQGITASYSSMGQAEQAVLRYNYLLSTSGDAVGDFSRTQDGFANQQRMFKGIIKETSGEIMSNMLPMLASALSGMNEFMKSMNTDAIAGFATQVGEMIIAFMPLVSAILPQLGALMVMLLPPLIEIAQMIMPIFIEVIGALMNAVQPIIPMFMSLVQAILPVLASLLLTIAPLLGIVGQVFMMTLVPAIKLVCTLLAPLLEMLAKVAGFIGNLFGKQVTEGFKEMDKDFDLYSKRGSEDLSAVSSAQASLGGMSRYALGGFASTASIFGEAGLEAAIPIKPGNPRSISLLQRTAQMLGVGEQNNNERFVYAPIIHADSTDIIEPLLKRTAREMREMFDDYMDSRGRLAWE